MKSVKKTKYFVSYKIFTGNLQKNESNQQFLKFLISCLLNNL